MIDDSIDKILGKEQLKDLAELLVNGGAEDVLVIYKDKETDTLRWATTLDKWVAIIGTLEIGRLNIRAEFMGNTEE